MGSNQYVNKNVNFAAQRVQHLDVFVDIWSILFLTLLIQMIISKCEQEYRFLVCKSVLIYAVLCPIG